MDPMSSKEEIIKAALPYYDGTQAQLAEEFVEPRGFRPGGGGIEPIASEAI